MRKSRYLSDSAAWIDLGGRRRAHGTGSGRGSAASRGSAGPRSGSAGRSTSPATNAVTAEPSCSIRDHAAVVVDRAALGANPVARDFPHLAGPEPRVLELVDQGLDHLALAATATGRTGPT